MKEFFKSNVGTGAKNFKKNLAGFFLFYQILFFLLGEGKNAFIFKR
jgi:hypothetical protein